MTAWHIERLDARTATAEIPALAAILVDCVEGGASVGFLAPLTSDRAAAFWTGAIAALVRGERAILVARDSERRTVGTVSLAFALAENQPHRAEVTRLLVHRTARQLGAGEALMRAVEAAALDEGRTLLVLDTATDAAARLYLRLGWTCAGVIPGYALNPDGSLCDTTLYWKSLA
jgi:ribosomal protein S18 acetylase RimI-like enzyme